MKSNEYIDTEKKAVLKLIALIFIAVALCALIVFMIIAIAKGFAHKPNEEPGLKNTEVSLEADVETEVEWDSEMQLYFDITRFDSAYGMNQRAASEPYLDRYDAVADKIKDAKAMLETLDPQSEEYAELLTKVQQYENEQDQIHEEWESMNNEVTEHYMALLQTLCEEWELDFEEWTNHLDDIITFEPGNDMSKWK